MPTQALSLSIPPTKPTVTSTFTSSATSTATPSSATSSVQPPIASPSNPLRPKLVVAHHMVGNTFPYTIQDWEDDIQLASASGLDGFALNYGRDDFQNTQLDNAYSAATKFPDFKLFLSMDMSSLPCDSVESAQSLRAKVLKYADHPNQLQYDSKSFVSTFAGENCAFDQGSTLNGWTNEFKDHPDLVGKITFVPSFFTDPSQFSEFSEVMDGDFHWNGGWPIDLSSDTLQSALAQVEQNTPTLENGVQVKGLLGTGASESALSAILGTLKTDEQHLEGLASMIPQLTPRDGPNTRIYMASVSPWFFTHFPQETFDKNFMYLSDEHLYSRRWENLIASRDSIDIVQLLTWNDWGESSYVSPIKGALPEGSDTWVNDMPHEGLLGLTKYYADAFKLGRAPTINEDSLVLYSRPHSVDAEAPDPVGKPRNFDLNQDRIWAVVLLKEPAEITVATSASNTQTTNLPAGISKLSLAISPGDSMLGSINRDGEIVKEINSPNFVFNGSPSSFNFNAFVASTEAS